MGWVAAQLLKVAAQLLLKEKKGRPEIHKNAEIQQQLLTALRLYLTVSVRFLEGSLKKR
jgi:hypothetical protein